MYIIVNKKSKKVVGYCNEKIAIEDSDYELCLPNEYDQYAYPDVIKEIVLSVHGTIIELNGINVRYEKLKDNRYNNCTNCEVAEICKEDQDFMFNACFDKCKDGYYFVIVN